MAKRCMGCMEEFEEEFRFCPNCGYEEGTPPKEAYHIRPGSMLKDRYLIGRVLGFGGFGITYIGYDTVLNHKVAIKEYLPSEFSTRMPEQQAITVYSGDREEQFIAGMEKFLDEARRLANFKSEPGIVHIYDCLEENYTAYIVMEYLEGESLREKLEREGKLGADEALDILMAVLKALEAVHAVGIIHRDIAPDNIYLTKEGVVKVLDFGAARYATSRHSKSLSVIIKPGYAPEEQYRSRGDQGPWTDVYAAAATFYKMVTGITPEDAMERAVKDTVKEPSKLGVPIKKSVETAVMNAMNVKIEGRTKTAKAFEEELRAADVKRIIIKEKKKDIGKWSLGMKIIMGACALAVGISLAAAAILRFNPAAPPQTEIPDGKTRVPNLVNRERAEAIELGQSAQLTVQIYDKQYSNEILADKVLSQKTREGTLVACNETLGIVISAGIEKTYVPDFTGMAKEDVEAKLLDVGLKGTYKELSGLTPPGTVVSQSIDPDTQVDTGTGIDLEISLGIEGGDSSIDVTIPDLTNYGYDEAARR
ncbi:protein kinase [Clostridium sp. AM58-1XD]|uniref:protein kinase domain-containing protein n=1 Tax=Clostridium sp. AM58-1XD TaxID=2292307 RepID=UPI000E477AE0|nr:protein kinase [Clostridium sp. AM58-1XD]RGZ01872.1 serine/threonine-protein kinase [Clostridium sp. AM58-1XD]